MLQFGALVRVHTKQTRHPEFEPCSSSGNFWPWQLTDTVTLNLEMLSGSVFCFYKSWHFLITNINSCIIVPYTIIWDMWPFDLGIVNLTSMYLFLFEDWLSDCQFVLKFGHLKAYSNAVIHVKYFCKKKSIYYPLMLYNRSNMAGHSRLRGNYRMCVH